MMADITQIRLQAYRELAEYCADLALKHLDNQQLFGWWFFRSVIYWAKYQGAIR